MRKPLTFYSRNVLGLINRQLIENKYCNVIIYYFIGHYLNVIVFKEKNELFNFVFFFKQ